MIVIIFKEEDKDKILLKGATFLGKQRNKGKDEYLFNVEKKLMFNMNNIDYKISNKLTF